MKILNVDTLLDGGTVVIETDTHTFSIDGRITSTKKGIIYNGLPGEMGSIGIVAERLVRELVKAMANEIWSLRNEVEPRDLSGTVFFRDV